MAHVCVLSIWGNVGTRGRFQIHDQHFQALHPVAANQKISSGFATASAPSRAIQFNLQRGVSRFFHELPSGHKMEVLAQKAGDAVPHKAPIVFVHGSYHAAWCWAVHWLPFFAEAGHDCFGLSLLGQGESDVPPDGIPRTLQLHASDVAHFIKRKVTVPPVLMGHSFGGLVVQFYLSCVSPESERWEEESYPSLNAAVLACSVPPTGNKAVVMRYLTSKPLASLKVTYSLAAKGFARSLSLCRETFFSPDMDDLEVQRYQTLITSSSIVPLFDLKKLNASLPVGNASAEAPPILVIGAKNDFILDKQAVNETAAFYKVEPVIILDIAHDIMLDTHWRSAANVVLNWLP